MPLLLGYNETISSNTCCCRYASMLGRCSAASQSFLSCFIALLRCHPLVLLSLSQCGFLHFCRRCPHPRAIPCLSSLAACTDAQLRPPPLPSHSSSPSPPSPSLSFLIIKLNDPHKFICHAGHSIFSKCQPSELIYIYRGAPITHLYEFI